MYVFIIFIFFELKNDNNVWLSSYIVYDEDEIDLKVKLWGNLAEEDEYKENQIICFKRMRISGTGVKIL